MKSAQGRRILLSIVALLAASQLGCAFVRPPGDAMPEQAALRVMPPRNGAQRFSVVKPAPDGALVVFENIGQQPGNPAAIEIGYAHVTLHASGWVTNGGGGAGGRPQHSVLLNVSSLGAMDEPMGRMIIYGKVVDPRVEQVVVGFPGGQVRDTIVNGLFGMVVVPEASLCKLELLDAEERQIGLFDYSGAAIDLTDILHGSSAQAKQDCALSQENGP